MLLGANAAKGIVERKGLCKVRHNDTDHVWLQQQQARRMLPLEKVLGTSNPADLMTKYLGEGETLKYVNALGLELAEGRAKAAAQLHHLGQKGSLGRTGDSWDAYGVPLMLVCDNGLEFHSDQLRRVCEELNTELLFCPKDEPHYKGSVERFQGTLNRAISHRLKGTSFSSIEQRGEYDSQKHAAVTLPQLDELIHTWIVSIYLAEIHRGIKQAPAIRWANGLANYSPVLPVSMTQFELSLCKQTQRQLRHTGVELFGLFYNCYALSEIRQQIKHAPKVKVSYDPENLARIWVFDPIQGNYLIVDCTEPEYANGLSLVAHKSIRRDTKQVAEDQYDASTQLERKQKFVEKIQKMQTSNKVTNRRRAARHKAILEQANQPQPDNTNIEPQDTTDLANSLPDLPFQYRGGSKQ